jgi:hypothetical protein
MPDKLMREKIAKELDWNPQGVYGWFRRRIAKEKEDNSKGEENILNGQTGSSQISSAASIMEKKKIPSDVLLQRSFQMASNPMTTASFLHQLANEDKFASMPFKDKYSWIYNSNSNNDNNNPMLRYSTATNPISNASQNNPTFQWNRSNTIQQSMPFGYPLMYVNTIPDGGFSQQNSSFMPNQIPNNNMNK